ncbi:MAG: hypothetical protein H6658_12415 [Ardenticatenaceae bacterium]|nr:hypothetical protein [Ardenticatenaceae bacterium]
MNKPLDYGQVAFPPQMNDLEIEQTSQWIYCSHCEEMSPDLEDCPICEDMRNIQAEPDYEPYVPRQCPS